MKQKNWFLTRTTYLLIASFAVTFIWIANADARKLCIGKKRKRGSAANRSAAADFCHQYKTKNPGTACIVDKRICPRGYVAKKKFRGCGTNYSSCVKGRKIPTLADRANKGKNRAANWCKTYSAKTGTSCKYVKTGRACPRGYRRYTKVSGAKIRNYKICVPGKKFGPNKQQVGRNCNAKMAGDTTKALDWIVSHYNDLTGDFEMSSRKRRDSRIKRRLRRKLRKVKVACHAKNNRMCRKKIRGQANGHPRKVHICFKKLDNFCELVEVLSHEVAHVARVPMSPIWIHNNKGKKRTDDHVDRWGQRAGEVCRASGANYHLDY